MQQFHHWLLHRNATLAAAGGTGGVPTRLTPALEQLATELGVEVQEYRAQIFTAVKAVKMTAVDATADATATANTSYSYFPPRAVKGQAPFVTMHSSEAASYSNFRFWPEALLASALPQVRLVQTLWHATTDTMLECTTDTTVAGP
jgi:hypothetical protein